MSGSFVRILRWDRSGCVATESFNIRWQRPDLLCKFLWCFSQTSGMSRSHDSTVQLASAEEQVLFQDVVSDAVRAQLEGSDVAFEDSGGCPGTLRPRTGLRDGCTASRFYPQRR